MNNDTFWFVSINFQIIKKPKWTHDKWNNSFVQKSEVSEGSIQFNKSDRKALFSSLYLSGNLDKMVMVSIKILRSKTSQVTYVTMVPRVGNETLRPLGVATGERPQRDSVWRYIWKNTTCWPATAHDVTTGVPQYKCRREDTSSASSSEACVRSMAQSPGDAVSRSPLGEPWLHT